MGLDGVELICDIEKQFDITISDNDAELTLTVNDIVNVVWLKLDISNEKKNIYKKIYLALKDILISFGIKEENICINKEIILFIPEEKKR